METIWNEVNVDANFTTYTKFTQSYSEAHFILVSNSFLAALGLRRCVWAFSSCVERGYSSLWCTGSSLLWLLMLRSTGSRRAGFSSCAAQVWLLCSMWDLPGPGLEPVSPALSPRTNFKYKTIQGASLVAQWLRICLLLQGTRVRALVREDPTCCGATKPVHHNY